MPTLRVFLHGRRHVQCAVTGGTPPTHLPGDFPQHVEPAGVRRAHLAGETQDALPHAQHVLPATAAAAAKAPGVRQGRDRAGR